MTDANNNIDTITTDATTVATPKVLTKAEKLSRIDTQIKNLTEKRYNIENDIVTTRNAAKVIELPEVGAEISFQYGRRTATTEPAVLVGKVVAIKPTATATDGKKTPAQIKVSTGEGFDQMFLVIYPAQIVDAVTGESENDEQDIAE